MTSLVQYHDHGPGDDDPCEFRHTLQPFCARVTYFYRRQPLKENLMVWRAASEEKWWLDREGACYSTGDRDSSHTLLVTLGVIEA